MKDAGLVVWPKCQQKVPTSDNKALRTIDEHDQELPAERRHREPRVDAALADVHEPRHFAGEEVDQNPFGFVETADVVRER